MTERNDNEEVDEESQCLSEAENEEEPKCCLGQTIIYCCVTFCVGFFAFCLGLSVMGALFSGLSTLKDVDYEGEPWPVTDEEGYYQSYKENGAWVNWWHRDMPSPLSIMAGFIFTEDASNIPSQTCTTGQKCALDDSLPITKPKWLNASEKNAVRATWIGHATVLAEIDGAVIITDPMFSQRCSPVQFMGPKRYRPPACTIDELPQILDAVVISHTHYDHLDIDSVEKLHQRYGDKLHWFVPSGSKSWFEDRGLASNNIHDMVWWQSTEMPLVGGEAQDHNDEKAARIIFTPANHFSRRGVMDKNTALWGSWLVIGSNGNKFWFGGDTAYSDVFKQIGKRYGPIDLSAIPIGAYHPRQTMKFVHVDPEEAVKIHYDLKSKTSFGIHWGTFKMTPEYYLEPKERILQIAQENPGMAPFLLPNLGENVSTQKQTKSK